ncbi:MAG: double-strand break repair helicase AddA [Alphaproteobacteria bacterium]|nr:double-strand break repair helicase AddA [Alphaproteobacteria bacterium]
MNIWLAQKSGKRRKILTENFNILKQKEALSKLATKQQNMAANPNVSVWVEASAGTGKTKVLSDRVLRLLLEGVNPAKILCLTYTKAAAVEMNNRIAQKLGKWAVIPEEKLCEDIFGITSSKPDAKLLEEAKVLFAKVLDTFGGIKIQTMHSFCEEILKRFPLEAQIAPYFNVMDDMLAKEALDNISHKLIYKAQDEPTSAIGQDISWLTSNIKELKFTQILEKITQNRNKLSQVLQNYQNFAEFLTALKNKLSIKNTLSKEDALKHFADNLDKTLIKNIADALTQSSKTDQDRAYSLYRILENFDYEVYKNVFITKSEIRGRLACKDAINIYPQIVEDMKNMAQDILDFDDLLLKIDLYQSTKAIMNIAQELNFAYDKFKQDNARLDFEDLVVITKKLLEKDNVAKWVLYKLDGGIDHILIDEAQDTSPDQWAIIKAVTDEFFAGFGQKDIVRTIFAVGDRKQSIYSFQGADSQEFDKMYKHFAHKDENFKKIKLDVSFRSTKAVLENVNHLFSLENAKSGVVIDNEAVAHLPYRIGEAGKVQLWPLVVEQSAADDVWYPPIERKTKQSASAKLAAMIAQKIKNMVENKDILQSKNRPVCYQDFMILVQRRNSFIEEFVRECKSIGVNVTGVDKLKILEQIAVQDLLSLTNFLLLPSDDLSLAEVLKSPLYKLDDDDLFELCHNRQSQSLFNRLRTNKKYATVYQELSDLIKKADYVRPFELFNYVLTTLKGREKFLSRLGSEAEDAIDEFINLSLNFEKDHTPDLQTFMQWIKKGQIQIKRELEQAQNDAVRIMTAHGSKGLQAPIVIIPDTIRLPNIKKGEDILFDEMLAYYPLSAGKYDTVCNDIHQSNCKDAYDEYRRLLYVALTRAEDRLYIAGYKNDDKVDENSWYGLCEQALKNIGIKNDDKSLVYSCKQEIDIEATSTANRKTESINTQNWIYEKAKKESPLAKPYSPSKPDDDDQIYVSSPLKDNSHYYARGVLIHSLLQYLPVDCSLEDKIKAIDVYLEKNSDKLNKSSLLQIRKEIITLLTKPEFEEIFSKFSRAEVPIAGEIDDKIISAQIDRLVITDNKVIIVDFKTNRPAADNISSVPQVYLKQLDIYKQLMEKIYPQKIVETYILWTNTANLMKIN